MGAERPPGGRSVREPAEGVLEALSSVAGQLGPTALVFAMECAAAVVAVTGAMEDAETEGPWAAGAHGIGEVGDVAVRLLLAEAAAEVAGRRRPAAGADVCTIDELCRLAAATARLQRSGVVGSAASDGATAAAATKEAAAHASVVLAAVQGLPLTEISIEAAAALVAAAWKATPVRVSWGQKEGASEAAVGDADGEGGDPPELPEHLLVALLERLAAATADPARIRRRADETRDGTNVEMASGTPPQPLPYEHALEVLTAVTTVAELMAETAPSTSASAAAASIPPERAEMLRAAGLVACRSLTPRVRELDAPDAVGLLMLVARAQRAGVRPDFPQLLWALHERLRALAASGSLAPTNILDVLSGCVSLRWRPAVLLRELLLPLLQWLEAVADGTVDAVFTVSGSASGGVGGQDRTAEAGAGGSGGMRSWSWSWSSRELRVALALLAKLRFSGPLATAVVKLGVGHLLRASEAEAGAATESSSPSPSPSSSSNDGGGARLSASDLALLMWVCVAMRYRGATVLRPLLQQLLQVPPAHVPVRAAAQAVWAAVRLGVVGERLVRWALASCQGGDKLAEAAPQNLALLCWGLAKLGVRPPRAFVAAAVAASRSQLRNFKAKELATALFVLATWGGKLRDAADAASVVRHVIETRAQYDGPGLCTAVWALNQLSAVATAEIRRAPEDSTVKPAAAASCILDAAALRAIETHLLAINLVENSRIGFPDHHLLRFFSTCAAIGYRPERLLSRYATRLHLRLRTMRGVSPVDVPVEAERRARMLWSSARIMATFDVRDPELLNALELCVERCQSQLRPGHLAGVLNAMAALGHYPEHFARHGLLRRVGLALRRATLTEAGLIMEALAVWKPYLTASGAGEETGSRDVGTVGGPAEEGNGLAAAAAAAAVMVVEARGPGRRGPTPQRLGLLRRMALARLTQLCAPPPPPTTTTTLSQSVQQPTIAAVTTSTSGASSGATRQSEIPPTAAPQTNTQTGTGDGFAAPAAAVAINISLDDAMRLLTALARLRWQCAPVEATLVQVLTRVPLERRRVPQLSTLMWSLASLRQDTPELLEDLQAALLGFPPQPSLASEMSLMESGRVDSIRIADASSSSLVAAAAAAGGTVPTETTSSVKVPKFLELTSTLTPLEEAAGLDRRSFAAGSVAGASAAPQPAGVANVANAADQSATSGEGLIGSGGITTRQSTRVDADVEGTGASDNTASSTASVGPDVAPSTSPRLDVQLLSRPAKPASSPADGDPDDATFDPAAATAAAAAEANQRLEKHLDGPMGRSQIPSEPWAPADIFKTLWSCAKMNRHPGPLILAAAERSWLQYTANGAAAAMPMHTITGLLWSLSVFRHHNGTFAQRLAQQLGNWLKGEGTLLAPTLAATATQPPATATAPPATTTASEAVVDATGDGEAGNGALSAEREVGAVEAQRHQEQQRRARDFLRQAVQVAACLLAAQADRADSPLNTTLSPEVRARLVAAWRSRLAQRLAKPPNRYQADLVSVLRKMGFTAAANVATPDGCALVDVAVAIRSPSPPPVAPGAPSPPPSPPRLLALELVGRHNTAANSPRILGEAVVKYRLLQARGYLVVPIPCYEWDRIDHKDIWTKMVYLQAKIERRTGSLTSSGVTVRAASTVGVPAAASLSSSDSDGNNNNNSGLGDGNGSGVGTRTAPQVVNALSAGSERRRNVAGSE
ncbi:hypothetical protein Vafri_6119 [Volvox africanus]|uniref:RAP domain-containing protein n=1 Tax=Volvox africanus TaxID=51714 RepID=A0A8J4EXX2_9CHLO|nr:hypothetical protein Vafri_6119 [Volvox africanus]